jgi:predicted component of type VI protein secretion system
MALSINGLGIQAYGLRVRSADDGGNEAAQRMDSGKPETRETGSTVRLSLSGAARQRVQAEEEARKRMADLSPGERREVQDLVGEMETMVGEAGGFRRLTETQWERVEEIHARMCEINGEDPADGNRLQDLKQVYSLEAELESLYAGDKPMTAEQRERADAIMQELGDLFGEQEAPPLQPEDEQRINDLETELGQLMDKLDKWNLTPDDEKRVNQIFAEMDTVFRGAERDTFVSDA